MFTGLYSLNFPRSLGDETSGQRRAKVAGCYADLSAKDGSQMALVGEPDPLRDESQRLIGPSHQSFCAFEPSARDVALRSDPHRLLERRGCISRYSPQPRRVLLRLVNRTSCSRNDGFFMILSNFLWQGASLKMSPM